MLFFIYTTLKVSLLKLINHEYKSKDELLEFINQNHLKECENLLLQVFTSFSDEKYISSLIEIITSILPKIKIIGSTTSGEISTKGLKEKTTLFSFSKFEDTKIETSFVEGNENSFKTGQALINSLKNPIDENIKVAICFTEGVNTNGEEFLKGIESINNKIIIAGGMAGDYLTYSNTYVFTQEGITNSGAVIATLKNKNLHVTTDLNFNWEPIGKNHTVTKSIKNRVYTIDNITTLEFYKYYIGDNVDILLPGINVELPLVITNGNFNIGRAILKTHDDGSMTYAGNIEEGSTVKFAYGNTNLILDKSIKSLSKLSNIPVEAIFMYSCIGRFSFLGKNIKIEIDQYNKIAPICGFLTHGEFFKENINSHSTKFLNQSMTILAIAESNTKKTLTINEKKDTDLEIQKLLAMNHLLSKTASELEDLSINLSQRVKEEIVKNEEKDIILNITQAQAEVGYMLEMIAHQWRQPLSAISSLASTIQLKSEFGNLEKKELETLLDEILDLSSFASQTIEDFRALFKAKQEREKIEIITLINKVKNILKSLLLEKHIQIEENYNCCKNSILYIPLGQTLQVLINIIKNAVDAIEEKKPKNPKIIFYTEKVDDFYLIRIEDNAGGIDTTIIQKIFEKRFSTKGEEQGTGLGLDICKTIIEKNLKGTIKASNSKDGASFEIKIPIYKQEED